MSIIQQLEDLKEWAQNPERYERRLAFRGNLPSTEAGTIPIEWDELSDREQEYYRTGPWSTREDYSKGQLVQPRQGFYKKGFVKQKLMSETQIKKIQKTLPEGVHLRWDEDLRLPNKGSWNLNASIYKDKKPVWRKAITNPTEQQIKDFSKLYEKQYDTFYPDSLTRAEFEKIRLKKKYLDLTDDAFAQVLNDKGHKTIYGKTFNKGTVRKYQTILGIGDDVGVWEKIPIEDIKKTIKDAAGGKVWLKEFKGDESELRKIARKIRRQDKLAQISGTFYGPPSKEGQLWKNLFYSSQAGDRIEIKGTFNGKSLSNPENWPRDKFGNIDWTKKDKKGVHAYKKVKFVDTQVPGKRGPGGFLREVEFTWGDNVVGGERLKTQMDEAFGKGFFERSTKAYDIQKQDATKKIMYKGRLRNASQVLAENMIIQEYKLKHDGKIPSKEYIGKKMKRFAFQEVHHPDGIGKNPYKTETALRTANRKLGVLEGQFRRRIIDKKTYLKS